MIRYYIPSITKCLSLLKELEKNPMGNSKICHELQESLIKILTRLENKIRNQKQIIHEIKISLSNRSNTKEISSGLKMKLKDANDNIKSYRFLITLFKSLGDGIAFLYIDKFDLKPQNFKPSNGFISNKKGNRQERRCFRYAFKKNGIAILNDLTNVLKYFDITIVKAYNVWIPVEIKSGTSRRANQQEKGQRILRYLLDDNPEDVYELGHKITRMETNSHPINNIEKVNSLLNLAKKRGFVIDNLDSGLTIMICYDSKLESLGEHLAIPEFVKPLSFFQNPDFISDLGYFPYCLSIKSIEDYLDILTGKFQIIQIFDFEYVENLSGKRGYSCEYVGQDDKFIKFTLLRDSETYFFMSNHFFGRIFFEYLSPDWLFSEQFEWMNKLSEIDEKGEYPPYN